MDTPLLAAGRMSFTPPLTDTKRTLVKTLTLHIAAIITTLTLIATAQTVITSLDDTAQDGDTLSADWVNEVNTLDEQIDQNAVDIASNSADISSNTSSISRNASDIAALEANSSSGSATGMLSGWPDAIRCHKGSSKDESSYFYLGHRYADGTVVYQRPSYVRYHTFNANGSFHGTNYSNSNCKNKSISQIESMGQAFYLYQR